MNGSFIQVTARDGGKFRAYLSVPESGKGPGILLCQEIFGINSTMRDVADAYAKKGYTVLAPDLFWRIEPNVELDYDAAGWKRAFEFFQKFDLDKGIADIGASIDTLRQRPECAGKIGVIGFCLGGKLAYLTSCRERVDASVCYYGVGIENALDEAAKIKCPVILHIAEKDEYCPPEAQAKIKAHFQKRPEIAVYSYPGQHHAFARENGDHYHKPSAMTAEARTDELFRKALA